jgi:hypothetical protein
MAAKPPRKPRIRAPIPPPGKPHGPAKGKRGYRRDENRKAAREEGEDEKP